MNILPKVYKLLENENTKIAKKVLNNLNTEPIFSIYIENDVFYFEFNTWNLPPAYVVSYLKKFIMRKFNAIYLYDLGGNF